MTELLEAVSGLKSLGIVYGILAVGYVFSRIAFRGTKSRQTYILSDAKGHAVKVTLDPKEPAQERARKVQEKVQELSEQAA